jgi:hypothetical protein
MRVAVKQALGMAAAVLLAASCVGVTAAAQPVPEPAADPFYASPPGLAAHPNGAILGSREIQPFLIGSLLPVRAWQVHYKSLDAQNRPTTGVATVIVPTAAWAGPGARPLLSYQVAEDSLGTRCDPSYWLRAGLGAPLLDNSVEAVLTTAVLQRNWAVVIPDYQGPQARFLDGPQAAHSVLDGIRASLAFGPAGLGAGSPLAAAGYSGGAFASQWAAGRQASYAPELHFAAVAVGGVPADLPASVPLINNTSNAGLGILAFQGLDRDLPDANIRSLLNDRGRRAFADDENSCGMEILSRFSNANLEDYSAIPHPWTAPAIVTAAAREGLQDQEPAGPEYIWHSTADDVLPVASTDALVDRYRAAGARVTYQRTAVPGHLEAGLAGFPAAMDWVQGRFAGRP